MSIHEICSELEHSAKVYTYPCGVMDIVASTKPIFHPEGWEPADKWTTPTEPQKMPRAKKEQSDPEDIARSMRRARAKVRRLALANDFKWFVTLTLDQEKIDRYNDAEVVKKLQQWASNQVKRRGLKYILVPERHKDGALHFHGFFNDSLEAVPSGHFDKNAHEIYNLPGWTLGFTAAIQCYGDYAGAVAYCCKYIGKQGEKPCGRWYYSGGDLAEPDVQYVELSPRDLMEEYGERAFCFSVPGQVMAVVNGIRLEESE